MIRQVAIAGRFHVGGGATPVFIAGPCVLESAELAFDVAEVLSSLAARLFVPLIFQGSYHKAKRSSGAASRGPCALPV